MAMQFNKPKFHWEARNCLSELEQFKQDCSVLFDGPLSEMKDAQKVGLVVNWISHQCTMTIWHLDSLSFGESWGVGPPKLSSE